VHSDEINAHMLTASAAQLTQAWVDHLARVPARCIEIDPASNQIFDF